MLAAVECVTLGFPTIRHSLCNVLIPIGATHRCTACDNYRPSLHSTVSRAKQQPSKSISVADSSSHTNYRYLTHEDLVHRLRNLHQKYHQTTHQLNRMKQKLTLYCEEHEGVLVDSSVHEDLQSIIEQHHKVYGAVRLYSVDLHEQKNLLTRLHAPRSTGSISVTGATNTNPTVSELCKSTWALRVANTCAVCKGKLSRKKTY